MLPWGTTQVMFDASDIVPLMATFCTLPVKYDDIHFTTWPLHPIAFSLSNRML